VGALAFFAAEQFENSREFINSLSFNPAFIFHLLHEKSSYPCFGYGLNPLVPFLIVNGSLFGVLFLIAVEFLKQEFHRNFLGIRIAFGAYFIFMLWFFLGAIKFPIAEVPLSWTAGVLKFYLSSFFILLGIFTVLQSAGRITPNEQAALKQNWLSRMFSYRWWIGYPMLAGTRTIFLFTGIGLFILWFGLRLFSAPPLGIAFYLVLFLSLFFCLGAVSLIGRILSLILPKPANILPRIVMIFFFIPLHFFQYEQLTAVSRLWNNEKGIVLITAQVLGPYMGVLSLLTPAHHKVEGSFFDRLLIEGDFWMFTLPLYGGIFFSLLAACAIIEKGKAKRNGR
jgi:hypothetical protein